MVLLRLEEIGMKSTSGYWCEMVNGERWCVTFDDYNRDGFRLSSAKLYSEIFGREYVD